MRNATKARVLAAAALMIVSAPLMAQTEASGAVDVDAIVAKARAEHAVLREANELNFESYMRVNNEALADLDMSTLTAGDIETLVNAGMVRAQTTRFDEITARCGELAKQPTAEGAQATAIGLSFKNTRQMNATEQTEALRSVLGHKGAGEAMAGGKLASFFRTYQRGFGSEAKLAVMPETLALAEHIKGDMTPRNAAGLSSMVMGMADLMATEEAKAYANGYESFRVACVDVMRRAHSKIAGDEEQASMADYLERSIAQADGAFARGKLVGHTAPDLAFEWSTKEGLTKLSDLKGQVVVIDFWATWCGPCIASFPKVRELTTHYEGYPVTVLGVTSLQGRHFEIGNRTPIDCADDPAKEYELMAGYVEKNDINWQIAFSKDNVFDPNFAVQGIPHVAIVAPDGTVRHRGMHPGSSTLAQKAELIDALLKEANLPTPAPPVAAEKTEKKDG